ncbi:MAG: T9SS type A sorting domain-containing protein [Crocinitomicaceae bacterium]|nr:T9SS type A sorting domain-containing protein [Crocinitomicaceae bacterium]
MKKTFTTLFAFCGILCGLQSFGQTANMETSATDVCPGVNLTLTNLTDFSGGGICSITSMPDNTTITGCQASYTWSWNTPGSYTIAYTFTPTGGATTVWTSPIITVHNPAVTPVLVADIPSNTVNCTNCVLSGNVIFWYIDGELVATDQTSYPEVQFGVPYTVHITTSLGGCEAESSATFTGIEDISAVPVRLFPNPASQQIRIISPEISTWYEIRDAVGRIIETGPTRTSEFTLDVSAFENGVYTLNLKNDGKVQSSRFLVIH